MAKMRYHTWAETYRKRFSNERPGAAVTTVNKKSPPFFAFLSCSVLAKLALKSQLVPVC